MIRIKSINQYEACMHHLATCSCKRVQAKCSLCESVELAAVIFENRLDDFERMAKLLQMFQAKVP